MNSQAATVHELYEADPRVSRSTLFWRAMNVGRSHIAATVNTLALAYVGASLPLIVLFNAGGQDPLLTASGEIVAVPIVKAIVGSIGIGRLELSRRAQLNAAVASRAATSTVRCASPPARKFIVVAP